LLYIFNLSFNCGEVPQSLKIAKVVPLYKKGDKDNPGNYRPISLLSIFAKMLEKLMYRRLYNYLHKQNILYKYQFGFRKGYSTSLALTELLDTLYTHRDQREIVIGMYFDLKKAFDTVDHNILLHKLSNYGVRGHVLNWFQSYLSNRQQFVCIGGSRSQLLNVSCGVPQGSVLGPLLFLLYINDIENSCSDCTVRLFADDTNLFVYGKNVSDVYRKANRAIFNLHKWFNANKLTLNLDKSCYSVFGHVNTASLYNITLGSCNIERVKCTKYLGLMIDSDLSWREHIDYVYNKILKFCGIFYKLKFKLPSEIMKLLYSTFVYPHLLYGIEVYANTPFSHIYKLHILNNKLLRIAQDCKMRTKINMLYKTYDILPISALHRYQVLLFVHKCLFNSHLLPSVFAGYFDLNSSVHSYSTRSSDKLHLCSVYSSAGTKCIKFKGCQLWNNLPVSLSEISSYVLFKRKLKDYLICHL